LIDTQSLLLIGAHLVVIRSRGAGAKQAGTRLIGHAIVVAIRDRHAVAVVLLLSGRLTEVVVLRVVDRPIERGALAGLVADLGGYRPIAPIEIELVDAIGGAAAGVGRRLGYIAVAHAATVVLILTDLDHVVADGAAAGWIGVGGAVVVGAHPVTEDSIASVIDGPLNRSGRQLHVILPTFGVIAEP